MKTCVIGGITGQDGAYLSQYLLSQNYKIIGISRNPKATERQWRLKQLGVLSEIEIIDSNETKTKIIDNYNPDECYNLEGQSSVAASFSSPHDTILSNGLIALDWLEAIRLSQKEIKFYQASSAEIFGQSRDYSRSEHSPLHPRSPYAVSKLFSHFSTVNYREAYQIFACCGILFNHESPLRGKQFVTQKIATAAANRKLGKNDVLEVGNIYAQRDWGHAKDFVHGMHLMLQQDRPDDYVLATGQLHTVKEFINRAYAIAGIELIWEGEGFSEVAKDRKNNELCVKINPDFYRPSDMEQSLGNPIKAKNCLKWKTKIAFDQLVEEMVLANLS